MTTAGEACPVQSAPILCRISSRSFTKAAIILNLISSAALFGICFFVLIGAAEFPAELLEYWNLNEDILEGHNSTAMLWIGILTSGVIFFFSVCFLQGIKRDFKDNLCLLTFFIVLLCLGLLYECATLFLTMILSVRIIHCLNLAATLFFLFTSFKYRKEVLEHTQNMNGVYTGRTAV